MPGNVVILGGTGFVGRHVVRRLLPLVEGRIRVVGRSEPPPEAVESGRVEYVRADLTQPSTVRKVLEGMDTVIHLASTTVPETSMQDVRYDLATNVPMTIDIAESLRNSGARRLVFASSGGTVYGIPRSVPITEDHPLMPVSAYGMSKLASEHYLRILAPESCRVVILRFANVYGEGQLPRKSQGVVAAFFHRALEGAPLEVWGTGRQQRDFVHADDVARAVTAGLDADVDRYSIFNIGSGRAVSLLDLIAEMSAVVGRDLPREFNPAGGGHRVDVNLLCLEAARKTLGWSPAIDLGEGLRRTWEWTKQEG